MNVETEAIIIKTQKYKEFDEIVTAFTKKFGKINMFAHSSKKVKSPLLSGTQLFGFVDMEIDLKDSSSRLFSSKIKKSYYKFSEDLHKYYLASYICEMIEKTQQENITDIRLFNSTLELFSYIENSSDRLRLIRLVFELILLRNLGVAPQLDSCVFCDMKDVESLRHIDISQGSVVCDNCVKKSMISHPYKMDRNLIRFIKYVYSNNLSKVFEVKIADVLLFQLDIFIQNYINYHLGNLNINSYSIVKEEEKINDNIGKN